MRAEQLCADAVATHDAAIERERKAWGDPARGDPRRPAEWAKAMVDVERTLPRAIVAAGCVDQLRAKVVRLTAAQEIEVRVTAARERMGDGGTEGHTEPASA